jgi:hypothetical protein
LLRDKTKNTKLPEISSMLFIQRICPTDYPPHLINHSEYYEQQQSSTNSSKMRIENPKVCMVSQAATRLPRFVYKNIVPHFLVVFL